MTQHLALFDLDHTLLPIDSDYEWARFLSDLGVVDAKEQRERNDYFYAQYKTGTMNIHEFLAFQLRPFGAHPVELLKRWHVQFMHERITPHIKDSARALVNKHQSRGDLCVIITGTNEFVTRPIADQFGIEHLLGVRLQMQDGQYTGAAEGIPSFREGKITRITEFLAQRGQTLASFASTSFYSDSQNDLPLLKQVTHPVAVNADDVLRAHALKHNWQTLELFA